MAFRMRVGVGGVLVTKEKLRSAVDRDDDGDLKAGLILGTLVKLFDKLCDINAVLAESRADRRAKRLPLRHRNLKLDITSNFLCHDKHLLNRMW